ncbi:MAG: hypothetical protein R3E97_21625 [Candidatus Eisenbacteria bacterium]
MSTLSIETVSRSPGSRPASPAGFPCSTWVMKASSDGIGIPWEMVVAE